MFTSIAPTATFPGWLNEGLAEYFEQRVSGAAGLSNRQQLYLRRAIEAGHWIPLAELNRSSFGRMSPEVATLAYAQSLAAVDYLARLKGERGLERFIDAIVRSGSVERALKRVYGLTLSELERTLLSNLA